MAPNSSKYLSLISEPKGRVTSSSQTSHDASDGRFPLVLLRPPVQSLDQSRWIAGTPRLPALCPEPHDGRFYRTSAKDTFSKERGAVGRQKGQLTKTKRLILAHLGLACGLPGAPCSLSLEEGSDETLSVPTQLPHCQLSEPAFRKLLEDALGQAGHQLRSFQENFEKVLPPPTIQVSVPLSPTKTVQSVTCQWGKAQSPISSPFSQCFLLPTETFSFSLSPFFL